MTEGEKYRRFRNRGSADMMKKLRKRTGLTQKEMGHVVGRQALQISYWELGKFRPDWALLFYHFDQYFTQDMLDILGEAVHRGTTDGRRRKIR